MKPGNETIRGLLASRPPLINFGCVKLRCGRTSGLVVSALASGSSGMGSNPACLHCIVFLGEIFYSHSTFIHPSA